jgi:hypothetical protein
MYEVIKTALIIIASLINRLLVKIQMLLRETVSYICLLQKQAFLYKISEWGKFNTIALLKWLSQECTGRSSFAETIV